MKFSNLVLASVVLAGSAGLALAQPAPPPGGGGRGAFFQACQADIQANCANAGRGAPMRQCLTDNQAKLSEGCKAAMAQLPPPGAGRGQ